MVPRSKTGKDRLLLGSLVLTLAVLAVLAWWQMRSDSQPDKTVFEVAFADGKPDALTSIEVRLPGEETIRLQPEGDDWMIVAPVAAKAKSTQVQQIITLLAEEVHAEYAAEGKNLAGFGLGESAISVSFNQRRFLLGSRNPTSQLRYVLYDGEILMVNDVVYGLLKLGLNGLQES